MRLLERLTRRASAPATEALRRARADALFDELYACGHRRVVLDAFSLTRFADIGLMGSALDRAIDDLVADGRARVEVDHRLARVHLVRVVQP